MDSEVRGHKILCAGAALGVEVCVRFGLCIVTTIQIKRADRSDVALSVNLNVLQDRPVGVVG